MKKALVILSLVAFVGGLSTPVFAVGEKDKTVIVDDKEKAQTTETKTTEKKACDKSGTAATEKKSCDKTSAEAKTGCCKKTTTAQASK